MQSKVDQGLRKITNLSFKTIKIDILKDKNRFWTVMKKRIKVRLKKN